MSPVFAFCDELDRMVSTQRTYGRSGKLFEPLVALSTPNNLLLLRRLVMEKKPEYTIETGLGPGGSASVFASCHRDLKHGTTVRHVAIDPYQKTVWDDAGEVMLEKASLSYYVEVFREKSFVCLPKLLSEGRRFDFAYIDGSHQFEDVFLDFFYVHEMLTVGGIIVFDDATISDVRKVIDIIEVDYEEFYALFSLKDYRSDRTKYLIAERFHKTQLRAFIKLRDGRREWNLGSKA